MAFSSLTRLPREIRDQIYAYLLRDEPLILKSTCSDEMSRHGLTPAGLIIHKCLVPELLRIDKHISYEYSCIAYESMRLSLSYVVATYDAPLILASLLSYSGWPTGLDMLIRSVSIQIDYNVYGPEFPKIHGVRHYISDLPALQRFTIDFSMMAELVEDHCSPGVLVPPAYELLADTINPSGSLKSIEIGMRIVSHMFHQNRNYHWTDSKEAKTVGNMWLHDLNVSVFRAKCSKDPHNWRGLELEHQGHGVSWAALWEECAAIPVHKGSLYIT